MSEGIENPYTVEKQGGGCSNCGANQMFDVVYHNGLPDELAMSTSFGDEEAAEDLCQELNAAHERAVAALTTAKEKTNAALVEAGKVISDCALQIPGWYRNAAEFLKKPNPGQPILDRLAAAEKLAAACRKSKIIGGWTGLIDEALAAYHKASET